jgi:hypothetical protein
VVGSRTLVLRLPTRPSPSHRRDGLPRSLLLWLIHSQNPVDLSLHNIGSRKYSASCSLSTLSRPSVRSTISVAGLSRRAHPVASSPDGGGGGNRQQGVWSAGDASASEGIRFGDTNKVGDSLGRTKSSTNSCSQEHPDQSTPDYLDPGGQRRSSKHYLSNRNHRRLLKTWRMHNGPAICNGALYRFIFSGILTISDNRIFVTWEQLAAF